MRHLRAAAALSSASPVRPTAVATGWVTKWLWLWPWPTWQSQQQQRQQRRQWGSNGRRQASPCLIEIAQRTPWPFQGAALVVRPNATSVEAPYLPPSLLPLPYLLPASSCCAPLLAPLASCCNDNYKQFWLASPFISDNKWSSVCREAHRAWHTIKNRHRRQFYTVQGRGGEKEGEREEDSFWLCHFSLFGHKAWRCQQSQRERERER